MSSWITSWSTNQLRSQALAIRGGHLSLGLLAILAAIPLALMIGRVHAALPTQPERATMIVGIVFIVLLLLPPALYLGMHRREATFQTLALIVLTSIVVLLVACFLYSVFFELVFPADILIWSESEFINDIVKLRQGYPLFTAQTNNESFIYPPGTQLLTYGIAWLSGHPTSLVAYRFIQVGYSLLTAIIAVSCVNQLLDKWQLRTRLRNESWWGAIWLPLLFLIATNSLTNPFTHLLHNDALAQLVTIAAFWVLLRYSVSGDKRWLWLMVIIPTVGFWVKQSLAIWAILYCLQIAFFQQSRSLKRFVGVGMGAFAGILISVTLGKVLWGENYTYWIFTVPARGVSPLRSFKHALDVWPYFGILLLGGIVLLRRKNFGPLVGPWVISLILISCETYTSGIAWMLNHIGPGSLIAGVWFLAALAVIWPHISKANMRSFNPQAWLRAGATLAVLLFLLSSLGIVHVPVRPLNQDAFRYISEVEREFQGQPAESVLLDFGTWVYAREGVVMKDRATNIGDRGYAMSGDFSGIKGRIEERKYTKILLRHFHSADFWYDHEIWPKPSGIKQAIMDNYSEVGKIKAVPKENGKDLGYGFDELSILVPRTR